MRCFVVIAVLLAAAVAVHALPARHLARAKAPQAPPTTPNPFHPVFAELGVRSEMLLKDEIDADLLALTGSKWEFPSGEYCGYGDAVDPWAEADKIKAKFAKGSYKNWVDLVQDPATLLACPMVKEDKASGKLAFQACCHKSSDNAATKGTSASAFFARAAFGIPAAIQLTRAYSYKDWKCTPVPDTDGKLAEGYAEWKKQTLAGKNWPLSKYIVPKCPDNKIRVCESANDCKGIGGSGADGVCCWNPTDITPGRCYRNYCPFASYKITGRCDTSADCKGMDGTSKLLVCCHAGTRKDSRRRGFCQNSCAAADSSFMCGIANKCDFSDQLTIPTPIDPTKALPGKKCCQGTGPAISSHPFQWCQDEKVACDAETNKRPDLGPAVDVSSKSLSALLPAMQYTDPKGKKSTHARSYDMARFAQVMAYVMERQDEAMTFLKLKQRAELKKNCGDGQLEDMARALGLHIGNMLVSTFSPFMLLEMADREGDDYEKFADNFVGLDLKSKSLDDLTKYLDDDLMTLRQMLGHKAMKDAGFTNEELKVLLEFLVGFTHKVKESKDPKKGWFTAQTTRFNAAADLAIKLCDSAVMAAGAVTKSGSLRDVPDYKKMEKWIHTDRKELDDLIALKKTELDLLESANPRDEDKISKAKAAVNSLYAGWYASRSCYTVQKRVEYGTQYLSDLLDAEKKAMDERNEVIKSIMTSVGALTSPLTFGGSAFVAKLGTFILGKVAEKQGNKYKAMSDALKSLTEDTFQIMPKAYESHCKTANRFDGVIPVGQTYLQNIDKICDVKAYPSTLASVVTARCKHANEVLKVAVEQSAKSVALAQTEFDQKKQKLNEAREAFKAKPQVKGEETLPENDKAVSEASLAAQTAVETLASVKRTNQQEVTKIETYLEQIVLDFLKPCDWHYALPAHFEAVKILFANMMSMLACKPDDGANGDAQGWFNENVVGLTEDMQALYDLYSRMLPDDNLLTFFKVVAGAMDMTSDISGNLVGGTIAQSNKFTGVYNAMKQTSGLHYDTAAYASL